MDAVSLALTFATGFSLGAAVREMVAFSRRQRPLLPEGSAGPGLALVESGPALEQRRRNLDSDQMPSRLTADTWVDAPTSATDARPVLAVVPVPRAPLADVVMRPASEHAAALLEFLQGPGGAVGELPAADVEAAYSDLCIDIGMNPRPWNTVAKALREALGDERKTYAWRGGHRVRVYRIPAARGQKLAQAA